jgi:hypothetical protein
MLPTMYEHEADREQEDRNVEAVLAQEHEVEDAGGEEPDQQRRPREDDAEDDGGEECDDDPETAIALFGGRRGLGDVDGLRLRADGGCGGGLLDDGLGRGGFGGGGLDGLDPRGLGLGGVAGDGALERRRRRLGGARLLRR